MDFALPPDVLALQREAEQVAADAVRDAAVREDSWLAGFSVITPAYHGAGPAMPTATPRRPPEFGLAIGGNVL